MPASNIRCVIGLLEKKGKIRGLVFIPVFQRSYRLLQSYSI
ncbi:MAG TPA: hypothetical protein PK604_14815 [Acetivibrio clariflavus]|nr:hypothetical protein [Acetivibrio clariflavus]HPU42255.1 hypothetical protein [Acetivibrio clariflavus]